MSKSAQDQLTVAVTGYSGLLGTHVIRSIFDLSGTYPLSLGRTVPKYDAIHRHWNADYSFEETVERLKGVDVLCHMAAYIPPNQTDPTEAQKCVEVNAIATLTLARAAIAAGVRRFVFTSSANIITKTDGFNKETDQPQLQFKQAPYYLSSKVLAESYLAYLEMQGDIEIQVVRLSSVYSTEGPCSILHKFVMDLKETNRLKLINGSLYGTDFVHVEDVAGLIAKSIYSTQCGIINAGSGERTTLLSIAKDIAALLGKGEDSIENLDSLDRKSQLGFAALDIGTARVAFNYTPRTVKQGVREIVGFSNLGNPFT